jgi:hypothetical protein
MKPRAPSVVWAYALLVVAFLWVAATRGPYPEALRYPTLLFKRDGAQDLGGRVPEGLWQLDKERLRRSIQRIAPVRLLRETGNSVRIALGQELQWVAWGGREPLMLFPEVDFWVSRGLTPAVEERIDLAARFIGAHRARLAAEGWTLVVAFVPVKLGIHPELATWPILESNLLTRQPIEEDRSGEVYARLLERVGAQGVATVDLHGTFRAAVRADPSSLMYVPGDSHWSGHGILLAARAASQAIARASGLRSREPVDPTFFELDYVPDLARAFDPLPQFTSRIRPIWTYRDRLLNGEAGRGYVYPTRPEGLVAAVGTSYTGQYTWVPQPVGFAWQVGLHLDNVEVQNRPAAGRGSMFAFEEFWRVRAEVAADFEHRAGPGKPRVVLWEFPIRDLGRIARAVPLP